MDVVQRGNSEPPRGLAVKSTSLYVARRWSAEIEVYGIGSRAQHTHVLAGNWRPDDLITSFTDNMVYLLGWVASNLQMVLGLSCDTGKIVASWPVVKMPRRLSMDSESNSVLVACQDALRSYSCSGLLKYVIPVKMNAGCVWHAVQIPAQDSGSHINRLHSKRFAICYGLSDDEPHCVSIIDNFGNILYTFGGMHAGSSHEELNRPIHLAVDSNVGVIYVLDSGNNAVKILRLSDVKLLDVFVHPEMRDPRRLALDASTRNMAVATEDGRILLFSY